MFKTISALPWSAVPLEDAVIESLLVKNDNTTSFYGELLLSE